MSTPAESLRLDHVGLSVSDLERARQFYGAVLGFSIEEDAFSLAGGEIRGLVLVNAARSRIELFERRGSQPSPAGHPIDSVARQGLFQFALRVDDVRKTFDRVIAAGATPVLTPRIAPDGRCSVAFIGDPDGNLIELIERPPVPA